jgi:hypothetical protein
MREEMEFHREARISDLVARGIDPEEAARTARLEFGNAESYREECRKELGYRPWGELYADLRFAVRGMKNNLGFAAATVTILALAIGVNAAFFSLYSNYVLKPLPIRGVDRHFSVLGFDRNARSTSGWSQTEVEALSRSVGPATEGLYVSDTFQMLAVAPVQRQAMITSVSGNYFRLLGGAAILGRTLSKADEHEHVAVLSSFGAARFFPNRANLTESTFTALLGAAGGCVLTIATVQRAHDYAISLSGISGITMHPVSTDWRVLLYSVVLGLAAGLAFGLLPAIEVTSPSLTASTKRENSSFAGRVRPRRMRNFLIGGQVAASLVLLIVGGVLIRNIQRLASVDVGYDLNRVFDLGLDRPATATLALLEQQPGVGAVTAVEDVPLHGRLHRLPVTAEGRTTPLSYNYVDHR